MRWLALLGSTLLAFTPGCSFMFVNGPPEEHEKLQYFDCASSGAALVGDITGAAVFALTAVSASQSNEEGEEKPPASFRIFLGAVSATYLASAIYGGHQGKQCDKAQAQLRVRIAAEREQMKERHQEQQRLLEQKPGCASDGDCKGERICEESRCVQPPPPPASSGSGDVTPTQPVAPEASSPTDETQGLAPADSTLRGVFPPVPAQ